MADLVCPRCNTVLVAGKAYPAVIHGCGGCGGVWLDAAACRALLERPPPAVVELAARAASNAHRHPSTERAARCPVCSDPLTRTRVPRVNVEVDACPRDGTWFDAGEVEAIARLSKPASTRSAAQLDAEVARAAARMKQGTILPDLSGVADGLVRAMPDLLDFVPDAHAHRHADRDVGTNLLDLATAVIDLGSSDTDT